MKKKGLTESRRSKYSLALKAIEKIIEGKEDSRGRGKHKKFIPLGVDSHRAVFQNSKKGY